MGDVQMLIEMGFPKERAEYALKVTNNKGVEPAMEWLLAHTDEPIPQEATAATDSVQDAAVVSETPCASNTATSAQPEVAKSLKCDDCGKLCRDQSEVEYHAAKTRHSNFSESTEEKKPLTEEQKKQQLALIEERLKQKRLEREEREKQDALERERNRIKSGKDMLEARRRMEEIEMKKIVEQRKREKAEEKEARERVKAQIEADRARRKASQQLSPTADKPVASSSVSSTTPVNEDNTVKSPPKDYKETRIQGVREEREKQDALERERNRIKSGKDMLEARRRMEEIEIKKIVEQRKREKAEDKEARERVKAQIEADRARRKASQQLSPTADKPVASSSVSSTTPVNEDNTVKSPPKAYKETRIQVRILDGSTLGETFNVNEQLSAVRVFLQMKTGTDLPFGLMTTFPRKVFNSDDFDKPLSALGLVPSAVLIMFKESM